MGLEFVLPINQQVPVNIGNIVLNITYEGPAGINQMSSVFEQDAINDLPEDKKAELNTKGFAITTKLKRFYLTNHFALKKGKKKIINIDGNYLRIQNYDNEKLTMKNMHRLNNIVNTVKKFVPGYNRRQLDSQLIESYGILVDNMRKNSPRW